MDPRFYNCLKSSSGLPNGLTNPNLVKLWLKASAINSITKAYASIVPTGSGTSGTTTITASATVANMVQAGAKLRIGGTDIYTVASISTITITTVETLTATYNAGSTLELDKVTRQLDISGNGNHPTAAAGTACPTYTPNAKNGKAALVYDGSDAFALPSSLFSIANNNCTVFAVASRTFNDAGVRRIVTLGEGGSTRLALGYTATANQVEFQNRTAAGSSVTVSSITQANYNILYGGLEGARQSLGVNGAAPSTNNSGSYENNITEAAVGAASAGVSSFHVGGLTELMILNRALTPSEAMTYHAYFSREYAIPLV